MTKAGANKGVTKSSSEGARGKGIVELDCAVAVAVATGDADTCYVRRTEIQCSIQYRAVDLKGE